VNDRDFWLAIRRALLAICAAIRRRYPRLEKEGGTVENN